MDVVDRIEALFDRHGRKLYAGERAEPVTALAHGLQCAQLAEWARVDTALVAAALLHDIGHFVDAAPEAAGLDDMHELRAVPFLASGGFGAAVIEPVRLHVQAKRYLVATDTRYAAALTHASVHSLAQQGGPMNAAERDRFEDLPFADDALQLRRWDDAAKEPGKPVPPLGYYLAMLRELVAPPQPKSSIA